VDEKMFVQTTIKVLTELDELKNSDEFPVEKFVFVSDKEHRVDYFNSLIKHL
jgi:hypothetical protein